MRQHLPLLLPLLLATVLLASLGRAEDAPFSVTDEQEKRALALIQTEEGAALEARYFADQAAGEHEKMVKLTDAFFKAHAHEGTPREQALRVSFHKDGFYHTLFEEAETMEDFAFLETEVQRAHGKAGVLVADKWGWAVTALSNLRTTAQNGINELKTRVKSVKNFAKEVKDEIKSTANEVKEKVGDVAIAMKKASGRIKAPFEQLVNNLGSVLRTAQQDTSDCHDLKIKPTGVGLNDFDFKHCFNTLPGKPCPSITLKVPGLTFETKRICNPSSAIKSAAMNAFAAVETSLKTSVKQAIDDITSDGRRFLETAEGAGGTSQLLAQMTERQVTRLRTGDSLHDLSSCSILKADFAVWFRYGVSFAIGSGVAGGSISANIGLAFGCDGAGTAFMIPTIDVGLDLTAGVGVTSGVGHSLAVDVFANYDGLGQGRSVFKGGSGAQDKSSVWSNKLGWGLGVGITVGPFGLGFSFTMPKLEIGTSNVLGFEFPSSANIERPRLAGIGISGDAQAIWGVLAGQPDEIADAVEDSVDKPELSISLGIGYVGILGGKTANWLTNFGQATSSRAAKAAGCNCLLNGASPSHIYYCGLNVFEDLPRSILTHWPYAN